MKSHGLQHFFTEITNNYLFYLFDYYSMLITYHLSLSLKLITDHYLCVITLLLRTTTQLPYSLLFIVKPLHMSESYVKQVTLMDSAIAQRCECGHWGRSPSTQSSDQHACATSVYFQMASGSLEKPSQLPLEKWIIESNVFSGMWLVWYDWWNKSRLHHANMTHLSKTMIQMLKILTNKY